MWADEEIALIVVFANLISAVWSYFCIVYSVDTSSAGYEFMHRELAWYALWYACQTYAFLVSITNVGLLAYVVFRLKDGVLEKIRVVMSAARRVLMRLLGAGVIIAMTVLCFIPFQMTMIQVDRLGGVNYRVVQ